MTDFYFRSISMTSAVTTKLASKGRAMSMANIRRQKAPTVATRKVSHSSEPAVRRSGGISCLERGGEDQKGKGEKQEKGKRGFVNIENGASEGCSGCFWATQVWFSMALLSIYPGEIPLLAFQSMIFTVMVNLAYHKLLRS